MLVFIHGESFEWNSGNPYDGSVLASYADMIVVTLNYRLGILGKNKSAHTYQSTMCNNLINFTGFLNANPAPHIRARVANYGLIDQIAALNWVQQNIEMFGGDPSMVTLAGHGTGAACIDFLMSSPSMGKFDKFD